MAPSLGLPYGRMTNGAAPNRQASQLFRTTVEQPGGCGRSTVGRVSIPTLTANDGLAIPAVGFGTFPHAGDDSRTTAITALDAGYRLLDTALR